MIWGVGQFMPQISGVVAADIQGKAAVTEQPGDLQLPNRTLLPQQIR